MQEFKHLDNPAAADIADTVEDFLQQLAGPTMITIEGEDSSRTRALVTLLHGNEPSGLKAIHRWIKSGEKPAVNLLCIIASVKASLTEPLFFHRMLPDKRDLNRCFKKPYDDEPGQLALDILKILKSFEPEAVVDMHNTSGSGPSFGVVTHMDDRHDALVSLFTQRLIVTDIRLGALMEISEHLFPTVTVECGGRLDDEAHEIAWEGINRYFTEADILMPQASDWGLELLQNPARLELQERCTLCYAEENKPEYDLVLKPDIENLNFGVIEAGSFLGWVNHHNVADLFSSKNSKQQCLLNEMIMINDGRLEAKQKLKLFMVTTNPKIAKMDCLFYAVKGDGQEIVV